MRLLLALGVLGGGTWLTFAFGPPACTPVTAESEVFCNRLWTPALFGMTAGFIGIRRWASTLHWRAVDWAFTVVAAGGAFMTIGNGAEYWVFSDWPHDGPDGWLRGMLWMTVLLGWLAVLLGSVAAGLLLLLGRRGRLRVMGLGAILVTAVCFTVFIGPLALGVLAVAAPLYVLIAAARAPQELIAEAT